MSVTLLRGRAEFDAQKAQRSASELWVVLDEKGRASHCAEWPEACHEHINDALNEHDISEARHWVVRRFVIAKDQP